MQVAHEGSAQREDTLNIHFERNILYMEIL